MFLDKRKIFESKVNLKIKKLNENTYVKGFTEMIQNTSKYI